MKPLSWSSMETLRSCGEKFRLKKVHAPELPSVPAMGGRAFHAATETWERDPQGVDLASEWQKRWEAELAKERARFPDESLWYVGGPPTRKQGTDWWLTKGLEMCLAYATALQETGWTLWQLPDNAGPGIELGLLLPLGGVMIHGYIDRVYTTSEGDLVVVDLKTGSRKPTTGGQLGLYACAFERAFGVRPRYGYWYMARQASYGNPIDLRFYTPEILGEQFALASQLWENGVFLPNPDAHCNYCGVFDFCKAAGGKMWRDYEGLIPLRDGRIMWQTSGELLTP